MIFDNLNWAVSVGKRIGLVGPNGAGKTTLLRVISGAQDVDGGTVARGGLTVGYLEQDFQEAEVDRSVLDEAMLAFRAVLDALEREHQITEELQALDDHDSSRYQGLLHDLDDVHNVLSASESHLIKPRTEAVLTGLGFEPNDLERPMSTFSGGWRMRVALARLLLVAPDVLLLDEPTNHLDIDSITWLEGYLKTYPGTVVIVSHDRYFLDRMVTTTVELLRGKATEYAGNYSYYLEARKEQRSLQAAAYENQQREIEQAESFIRRFRAKATKARQVQSRVKALERLERIPPPPTDEAAISIRFPEPSRSGKVVFELSQFSKSYPALDAAGGSEVSVFDGAGPLMIERGDKIALIGRNGAGKSTLARIINGSESFDGTRSLGHNVELTFFAQHQAESLSPKRSILDELLESSRGHTETEIRTLLGAFLFTGDDVFKRIGVLSGGERSRVALAKALLVPANFMILDEPTNHLDIQSVNVLIEAMRQYTGSFLVVSHDRHFLDSVTNRVWRAEQGSVRQFTGNYSDYLWQLEHGTASRVAASAEQVAKTANGKPSAPSGEKRHAGKKTRAQRRAEAEQRNAMGKKPMPTDSDDLDALSDYQLRKLYSKVEQKIFQAERKQRKLEKELNDPALYNNLDLARTRTDEYESGKSALEELYAAWAAIGERLEST